jgi:NADP-dependent 3-hydroxy acid dehydrogenase YdfG
LNKDFVTRAAGNFGRIDILVNNAGHGNASDPLDLPEEVFRHKFITGQGINVDGGMVKTLI